ncbi:MAG: 6,7-dimethyl-8-ribityllumazine synthase [Planctomycetota bacterium]|jgi:6,7-dimethyl-8-ribityllumazine synthase
MQILEGQTEAGDRHFAIVASRFNEPVTRRLLEGCTETLRRQGVADDRMVVAWGHGAYELPLVARRFASSGQYAAVITLGCVIRGETSHYDIVCNEAAAGVSAVVRDTGVPCILGVVTTENRDQALSRSGGEKGNKGADAAMAALEMADLLPRLVDGTNHR